MTTENEIFSRAELLLGEAKMASMAGKKVILFGVGGVGSWCAEGLIRNGIGHLTLVDYDHVSMSNINRQLMATTATVGQVKVEVMRDRLLQINPHADIVARHQLFTADTADSFCLDDFDYIIDAIDSLSDKQLLILMATRCRHARLFSSMGAALKLNPAHIRVAEFWKVTGDPLARALRNRFKREKTFPARKFLCVFSDEKLNNQTAKQPNVQTTKQPNGSLVHITAIFGFTLAGLVVQDICQQEEKA